MPLLTVEAERREADQTVMADPGGLVEDDLLRLVLMCAHPALPPEAASALALRLVLGVSTHDIARLFLVSAPTMAARITRAKRKVVGAAIPFAVPSAAELPARLDTLTQVVYLAFTAGYAPSSGPDPVRAELAGEAIRLTRLVRGLVDAPALAALLALMLLQHSRRDSRVDAEGRLVLLPDQDRSRWHQGEIDEALQLLDSPALSGPLTPATARYVVQARIAAEHATAPSAADTRWDRVVAGYDVLLRLDPSPGAALARAVAVAEASGPEAGLRALDDVDLPASHRPHAVRGELLARLGRRDEAVQALETALSLCRNEAEREHLASRVRDLTAGP